MSTTALPGSVPSFDELAAKRMGPVRRYLRTHPRFVTISVCLFYLIGTLPGVIFMAGIEENSETVFLLTALATAVTLLFRRRAPMTVLLLVFGFQCVTSLVLGPAYGADGLGTMLALYMVATSYSAKRTVPLAILAAGFQMVLLVLIGYPDLSGLDVIPPPGVDGFALKLVVLMISAGFLVMLYLITVAVGVSVRNSRIHEAELNHWASQVSSLAQIAERNRIAREMHDVIAHSLSVMIALSDGARVVSKKDPERAGDVLAELSNTLIRDHQPTTGTLPRGWASTALHLHR